MVVVVVTRNVPVWTCMSVVCDRTVRFPVLTCQYGCMGVGGERRGRIGKSFIGDLMKVKKRYP